MSNKYEIINEVMCCNGIKCELEFGNQEQINVLRKYEEMLKSLNTVGLDIYPEYEIKFRFDCICGYRLSHEEDIDEYDQVEDYTPIKTCTCNRCNRYYAFETQGTCSEYVVKLLGFKKTHRRLKF